MKICLISPLFDPWLIGGAEKYVTNLAKELSKHHEVLVITSIGPIIRNTSISNSNLKIIEIKPSNVATLYEMLVNTTSTGIIKKILWHFLDIWNLSVFTEIKKILKREKPDLVHTNGIKGLSSSVFSAIENLQIPHIHTLHDYELISPWSSMYRCGKIFSELNNLDRIYLNYMRKMSSSTTVVMSPSKFLMDFHTRFGFFKTSAKYVVPHGMILDKNTIPKERLRKGFLYVGQITEHKGPQIAVAAIKRIKDNEVKLHIVGTGPYLGKLKEIADGDERIILHGFVQKKEELDSIFSKCSFFIFPSIWNETFGLVINEAMNKGLPVIASNIGAIPEIVKDGYNGFLFEPGNIDSLRSVIDNIINDKAIFHQLSKNAIESSKRFTVENQIDAVLKIYNEASIHHHNRMSS